MTKLEALDEMLRLHQSGSQYQFVNQAPPSPAGFLAALQTADDLRFMIGSWLSPALNNAIQKFVRRPDVEAAEAVRFLELAGDFKAGEDPLISHLGLEHLQSWWQSHDRAVDLQGFALLWKGRPQDWMVAFQDQSWCNHWPRLEDDFLRGYLRAQLPYLLGSIGVAGFSPPPPVRTDFSAGPQRALKLLSRLPGPPPESHQRLWELALGEARLERQLAQECLRKLEGWQKEMLSGLRHSQAGVRQRAAEWAGRARLTEALPLLTAALRKEKVEKSRLAQMEALKLLGAPLETYLNREGLLAEARANLAKGRPEWLTEVPLPALRWSGSDPIEPELLQGLLVGAVRLKNPEPSAWLKTIFENIEPARMQWGQALLEWWIAKDTSRRLSAQEIEDGVREKASALEGFYRQMGTPKTLAAVEAELRHSLAHQVEGSAIELKGLLAVAGACAGVSAVATVQAYLKEWYGQRAAQCKALVAMLAHLGAPEAVQYLLAVARRFRTKGIQEEAQKRLRERAERLGWTLEDMADLSLPDGGLEDDGTLHLDYGDRVVTVKLQPDGSWSLKTLPPGADPEVSKRWKAAQKAVKEVAKSVADRLYDAMCSGRSWPYTAWETCLLRHPLARRVCQKLVWSAGDRSFRPTEDGTLIDADHQRVEPESGWTVTVSHPLHLGGVQAWQSHLSDYLLIPPFPQLGRPPRSKPVEPQSDFLGHMLTSFDLRNRAKTLGYERAPAEDGGVFMEYRKSLGTSGWVIRIRFSGSQLPETQHPVALEGLSFDYQGHPAVLAEVPEVLWSEAYNDADEIARTGTGYDPEWSRKVTLS